MRRAKLVFMLSETVLPFNGFHQALGFCGTIETLARLVYVGVPITLVSDCASLGIFAHRFSLFIRYTFKLSRIFFMVMSAI